MSEKLGEARLELRTDSKQLDKGLAKAHRNLRRLGAAMGKTGKLLTTRVTAPLLAAGAGFIALADKQRKAEAALANAIRTTGTEADVTVESMKEFASSLQQVTTFGDEVTLEMAAVLQSFAKLNDEGLRRVIPLIQDAATTLDMDLGRVARRVGAVLAGTSNSLIRFGVEVDSGATKAERLATVTKQLEENFGGAAKAAAEAGAGPLVQLKNALGDIGEQLGEIMLPVVNRVADRIRVLAEAFATVSESTKRTIVITLGIAAAVGPALLALAGLVKGFMFVVAAFRLMGLLIAGAWPWGVLITAVAGVAALIIANWEQIKEVTVRLWNRISRVFENMGAGLVNSTKAIGLRIAGAFSDSFERIGKMFGDFGKKVWDSFKILMNPFKAGKRGRQELAEVWVDGITDAFTEGFKTAGGAMVKSADEFAEKARVAYGRMGEASRDLISETGIDVEVAIEGVVEAFGNLLDGAGGGLEAFKKDFEELIEKIEEAAKTAGDAVGVTAGIAGESGRPTGNLLVGPGQMGPVGPRPTSYAGGADAPRGRVTQGWVYRLGKAVDVVSEKMEALGTWAHSAVADAAQWLVRQFVSLITSTEGFREAMQKVMGLFRTIAEGAIKPLFNALAPLIAVVQQLLSDVMPIIVSMLGMFAIAIKALMPFWQALSGLIVQIVKIVGITLAPVLAIIVTIFNALAPILNLVTGILELLEEPLKIVMQAFNVLGAYLGWVIGIFGALGKFILNLVKHPLRPRTWGEGVKFPNLGDAIKEALAMSADMTSLEPTDTGLPDMEPMDYDGGAGGSGATFEQARPINVTVNVNDNYMVGEGGFRDLAIILRDEMEAIGVLGL